MSKQFLVEENIFDSISDWISIIDLNFKIQYSNKAGELLFGLKKDVSINPDIKLSIIHKFH